MHHAWLVLFHVLRTSVRARRQPTPSLPPSSSDRDLLGPSFRRPPSTAGSSAPSSRLAAPRSPRERTSRGAPCLSRTGASFVSIHFFGLVPFYFEVNPVSSLFILGRSRFRLEEPKGRSSSEPVERRWDRTKPDRDIDPIIDETSTSRSEGFDTSIRHGYEARCVRQCTWWKQGESFGALPVLSLAHQASSASCVNVLIILLFCTKPTFHPSRSKERSGPTVPWCHSCSLPPQIPTWWCKCLSHTFFSSVWIPR